MQNVMLEQKHLHLVQIVESERTAKKNYSDQCEELDAKVHDLEAKVTSATISHASYIFYQFYTLST